MAGGLGATLESERLEHDRVGQESLEKGTANTSRIVEMNLAVNGLADGSSRGKYVCQLWC